MRYTANKRGFMLCNNRISLDIRYNAICDCCIGYLVIWFYRGLLSNIHSWTHFIHSFHDELVSLVHVCLYLDNRLSLDIIGMFPYILLSVIPMLWGLFHFVIIHRLFFCRVDLWLCCAWPTFSFYHIEVNREECYIRKKKSVTCKNYYSKTL